MESLTYKLYNASEKKKCLENQYVTDLTYSCDGEVFASPSKNVESLRVEHSRGILESTSDDLRSCVLVLFLWIRDS